MYKRQIYIARARSVRASEKLNEMLSLVNTGPLSAFEEMEEKIMQLEAQSEAMAELETDSLEKKFTLQERDNDIETELKAMKAEMLLRRKNSQSSHQ